MRFVFVVDWEGEGEGDGGMGLDGVAGARPPRLRVSV